MQSIYISLTYFLIISSGAAAACFDAKHKRLPKLYLVVFGGAGGIIASSIPDVDMVARLQTSLAIIVCGHVLWWIFKAGMRTVLIGRGDINLVGAISFSVGYAGTLISIGVGLFFALCSMFFLKKQNDSIWKQIIPLGPFLIPASILTLFYQHLKG